MAYNDDYDPYWGHYDDDAEEERQRQADLAYKELCSNLSPAELGKEWQRHCRRHDSAVDRCEQINSPTIEDAQGWMGWIDKEFERRGIDKFKFTIGED